MSLIRWRNKGRSVEPAGDVGSPLSVFRDELDALFDRFFRDPWGLSSALASWPSRFGGGLRLDMSETADEVTLKVEVPGVEPEDLDITVTANVLSIRGEKRRDREQTQQDYHLIERQFGSFQRSVQLPAYVDSSKVEASFHQGVLTITMPKRPEAKPKRIEVRKA